MSPKTWMLLLSTVLDKMAGLKTADAPLSDSDGGL